LNKYFLLSGCDDNGLVIKKVVKSTDELSIVKEMIRNPMKYKEFLVNDNYESILKEEHLKLIIDSKCLLNGLALIHKYYIPFPKINFTSMEIFNIAHDVNSIKSLFIIFILKDDEPFEIITVKTNNQLECIGYADLIIDKLELETEKELEKRKLKDRESEMNIPKYGYIIKTVFVNPMTNASVLWSFDKENKEINYKVFTYPKSKIKPIDMVVGDIHYETNTKDQDFLLCSRSDSGIKCFYESTKNILSNNLFVILPSLTPIRLLGLIKETYSDYNNLKIQISEIEISN